MSLIKNTSYYTLGGILPKIGAFIFLPIYLKYLSPTDYGIVSSLQVLNAVFIVLLTFSMPRALYRIYYDYTSKIEQRQLVGTVLISVLVLAIVLIAAIILMHEQVQKIYISIPFFPYYAYAIAAVFFQALHVIPTIFLQIKERAATFIKVGVSLFFVKSFIILVLIVKYGRGARGYLEAELIAAIIFLPIYYYIIHKDIVLVWKRQMFLNVLKFSLPIIPSILSAWTLNLSDRIFIERYFSAAEVGIYSLGYQIAGLVLIFSIAFKKAYDPYFYKIANTEERKKAEENLYKTNYVFVLILLLITFVLSLFAREGVMLFLSADYYDSIQIIPVISLAYLMSQNSALLNVMMYQNKQTGFVMYITLGSAVLNIILNYILIPRIGITGAAYATLISFSAVFVSSYFMAKKTFFIPYNWKKLIPAFVLLVGIYLGFTYAEVDGIILSIALKVLTVLLLVCFFYRLNKEIVLSFVKAQE